MLSINGTDADDTDATGNQDSASMVTQADVQVSNAANTAPKFDNDQDPNTPGKQADAMREVVENEKGAAAGDPVIADRRGLRRPVDLLAQWP